MKKLYIIKVDESEVVECWNEQAVKEIGYQEYALKKCPEIKVKPYNPTGDLISRSDLKEQINATDFDFGDYYDNTEEIRKRVCGIIDNAMSMHYTFLPQYQADLQGAYDCGYEKGKQERPQGEWIIVKDEKWGDNVKCPFCGKELAGTDLNFCCKCGADMRKGGKE